MARYYGRVGYGHTVEVAPGVYEDVITERPYYGNLEQITKRDGESEYLHKDLTLSNVFSIVADAYAHEHFFAMKYIEWQGTLWSISSVELKRPRLIVRPGGVYHGPTAEAP